ncbi:MAG: prepilin-type N-terminal cleavage/methylation domain-containing protein [Clostridiales bacterium]|nr:prepilin-type N-terminal cleavage/methylation domain-containing protein [Clostridiales bacterium]
MDINKKNEKGFTLVEIIIAIAALALVCGLVLQLFILAGDVNRRAIQKQYAINECSNIIEVLHSFNSLDEIYNDEFFSDSIISNDDNKIEIIQNYHIYDINVVSEINIIDTNIIKVSINANKDEQILLETPLKAIIFMEVTNETP